MTRTGPHVIDVTCPCGQRARVNTRDVAVHHEGKWCEAYKTLDEADFIVYVLAMIQCAGSGALH